MMAGRKPNQPASGVPGEITHAAVDVDAGMSTTEIYEWLVAITTAGLHHPCQVAAVTGSAGQLLALTTRTTHHPTHSAAEGVAREENR